MIVLHDYYDKQILDEVKNEAEYVAQAVKISGEEYFTDLNSLNRITWVNTDGTVLYDSVADVSEMENHANRTEIKEAFADGEGSSIRYSNTISEKTIYYAVLLEDDTVIRVSVTQYTIWNLIIRMIQPLILVTIVVLVIAFLMATTISKKIVKPINEIDLEHPDVDEDYEELLPLLHKIDRQNHQIELQMNHLRRQQKEFSMITDHMAEGFLLISKEAEIVAYNNSIKTLLDADEIENGSSVFTLNRSEPFRNAVNEALDGKHCEEELINNGRIYHLFANPVEVDNEFNGAVVVIMDVTEKEKRKEMRREFSANVSHELKTPLTSIYGTSELMLNGLVKPEDMQTFAKSIHDESGRLITLVNDIIKLSQLDDHRIATEKEEVDLYKSAKEVMQRLESIAETQHISMELIGEHAVIRGIPSIITEIIYNLCDNAIKYNKKGGNVHISVRDEGKHKILSVKDNGIGVPKEHLDRIFERFYSVDKSRSKAIGGTGLGLSIVKHGAQLHHADVHIESAVGEGTEITITF
jgi:two-component system phosphate regulon sensor histidine kinase PhoR